MRFGPRRLVRRRPISKNRAPSAYRQASLQGAAVFWYRLQLQCMPGEEFFCSGKLVKRLNRRGNLVIIEKFSSAIRWSNRHRMTWSLSFAGDLGRKNSIRVGKVGPSCSVRWAVHKD